MPDILDGFDFKFLEETEETKNIPNICDPDTYIFSQTPLDSPLAKGHWFYRALAPPISAPRLAILKLPPKSTYARPPGHHQRALTPPRLWRDAPPEPG